MKEQTSQVEGHLQQGQVHESRSVVSSPQAQPAPTGPRMIGSAELANYSLRATHDPWPVFISKVLLAQLHACTYVCYSGRVE